MVGRSRTGQDRLCPHPLFADAIWPYWVPMLSLRALFRSAPDPREIHRPLWQAIIATARAPHWYRAGKVADTLDGRFEMIVLIFALVLHRIDAAGGFGREAALLTELFVEDMDGQIRQIGFGDMVVGKQIGKMVGALGGRIGVYQAADDSPELRDALTRNLWRGETPDDAAIAHVMAQITQFRAAILSIPAAALIVARELPVLPR